MFESLPESKPDAILQLMEDFKADTRKNKVDLGVGIYKDPDGNTPVLRAVKQAEKMLLETQDTKAYVGPIGSRPFCEAMVKQVFGTDAQTGRIRCAQSNGGTGALRVLADLLKASKPDAAIWVSDPTWPNHIPVFKAAGIEMKLYPYYDAEKCSVDFDAMISALKQANDGDIVLLHGCCHNPTGADLNPEQWQQVADLCVAKSLFPFIDLAYQGFGDGLEEDAASVRLLASIVPELVVAASCSKNLGLYRERTGAAMLLAENSSQADSALGQLSVVIRSNYSMPPDHGANTTNLVMTTESLNKLWRNELEEMRSRMIRQRTAFAEALRKRTNSGQFDYIVSQKGMFSRLPLSPDQIKSLKDNNGIYLVGDGRINIAGLPEKNMDALADAIASVL